MLKLVAYSKTANKVYAVAKDAGELLKKIQKKKIDTGDIVFAGPIQKSGRIYVYSLDVWDNFSITFDNKTKKTIFHSW